MDYIVADTVRANTLDVDDYVRIDDTYEGRVLAFEEEGDEVILTISDADEYDDRTEVRVAWDAMVDLLDSNYEGVEV